MNKEELAARLTGREYGSELTRGDEALAKAAGLVVVFGASDDLMEFRGAIHDEAGLGAAYVTPQGLFAEECDSECKYFRAARDGAQPIQAVWSDRAGDFSFTYKTDIPHATFEIYDDGEKYCRGIVFRLADVTTKVAADSLAAATRKEG